MTESVVFRHGSARWLLGVDWHYADDAKAAQAKARELLGVHKDARGLKLPNADGTWLIGVVPAKLLTRKLRIAAPAMASAIGDGIIILPTDDDRLWMAAFAAGCVLPHRDVVVARAQRDAVLAQWFADMGGAHLYGEVSGALEDAPACWQRLQQAWDGAAAHQKRHWQAGSSPALRWGTLTMLTGALGAGIFLWLSAQRQPATDAATAALQMARLEQLRQQQEDAARQQRLRQRFDEQVQQRRQALLQRSAGSDLQQLLQWLQDFRSPAPYGKLAQMRCTAQSEQLLCTPSWQLPASAGRLARLSLGARLDAPTTGEIFEGQAHTVALLPRPAASSWPYADAVWAAWLHDQVLLHGFRDVQWQPPQDVVVRAAEFQENGQPLRDTADAKIAQALRVRIQAPLARWMQPGWVAWLTQGPSRLEEAELRNAQLSVQLIFYQPSPSQERS
ncbi:MAG: hypothetical protein N2690_00270 [Rhodocyclaceae bacterium]|nr:hypothetical protein [Rhodocyclaceae bacterium]